uniref:NADH-ubiquinone oxidoreductase chain 1 n=1 Tax=Siphonosoma cumanense TaxID=6444 RepID=A0A7D4V875_SIPCU|nr:NADH dehydrogenase subunit 1 [Siphonosoma cumanense]QKS32601.1 NADH dehydrogenase subunit 1 [Siphonosoma cumanense]
MAFFISLVITYLMAALAMAFYTLVERKLLGYFQTRKGPNKVGLMGLPQPFADALKLFAKEISTPTFANLTPFILAPAASLIIALTLWYLYPHLTPTTFFSFSILFFLMISSLNVYTTLGAGWSSNSKYALLGALRGVAQTISYEVSMILVLLSPLMIANSLNFLNIASTMTIPIALLLPLTLAIWFITTLAETNRTPFDFAEGESELVSGFNTEYSSGTFALIFMAEYMNILFMSLITAYLFFPSFSVILSTTLSITVAFLFIWVRATLPRMRYDRLMSLTWKVFLPFSLSLMLIPLGLSFVL